MASSSCSSSSSTPARGTPPAAVPGANPGEGPFGHAEQCLAEAREDLRAVARKLSSCEDALEGRGAYLGITDPVREGLLPLLFNVGAAALNVKCLLLLFSMIFCHFFDCDRINIFVTIISYDATYFYWISVVDCCTFARRYVGWVGRCTFWPARRHH